MRGRGEAREKQHRVVARGVELAPGLVGDTRAVQRASAPHGERDRATLRTGAHPWGGTWDDADHGVQVPGRRPRACLRTGASTGSARRCRAASRGSPSPCGASAATLSAAAKVAARGDAAEDALAARELPALSRPPRHPSPARSGAPPRGLSTAGTKSGVQPWILCGAQGLPESSAAPCRLAGDDLHLGAREPDHLSRAGERAAGAPAGDEVVEPLAGEVLQDLGARWCCGGRPGFAAFSNCRARNQPCFLRELLGLPHHAAAALGGRGEDHLGAEHAHDLAALDEKVSAIDGDEGIALGRAHHGERDAGVARGRLDHGLPGLERAPCARRPR